MIPTGRYGLIGMRERARLIGAKIEIKSKPGAGTMITFTMPGQKEKYNG